MPLAASAQTSYKDALETIYDSYLKKQGFTTVELSKDMLRSMGVKEGIDSMTAISTENTALLPEFCEDVAEQMSEFKQMMSFVNDGKSVQIFASPAKSYIIIFTRSDTNAVFIALKGTDIKIENAMSVLGTKKEQ